MNYKDIDLRVTEDHNVLKESVREFAREVLRPAAIELDALTPEQVVEKDSIFHDCMRQMYELDYHTVMLPEAVGGSGLDPLSQHIFFEEVGYASAGFAVAIAVASFAPLFATLSQRPELIEKVVLPFIACKDASNFSCWGITEPNHGSDNLSVGTSHFRDPNVVQQVRAKKVGNEWILNGQKSAWVSCAPVATNGAIFVNIDPSMGISGGGICIVDLTQPGVSKGEPLNKIGQRDLPQGELFFDNAVCPEEMMVFDQQHYEMMTGVTLAHANALMGAIFTGVARSAYDLALQHCTERTQGGKLLSQHQLVQKKLFDMFAKVEAARSLSRSVVIAILSTETPDKKYSIVTKVTCTNTAFEVASEAVQLFGGYGLTKEYPIEKIFRDARAGMIEDGSNDVLSIVAGNQIIQEAS